MSDDFSGWSGRQEEVSDVLEPARTNALSAALGETGSRVDGAELPPLHHWLYFWDVRPPTHLGQDGHPARGGFLPPVHLPRRMWAGGRLKFLQPLRLGEKIKRTSTIQGIESKTGSSGSLVFVTVKHELFGENGLAVVEEQDIVYREAGKPGSVVSPVLDTEPPDAPWCENIMPDTVLLFRYSALTMNGHRIHYDRPYAEQEESYPALVVHGPLQAILLARMASRNLAGPLTAFEYRGRSPAFEGVMLHVCGIPADDSATLWTQQGGEKKMVSTARCGDAP